VVLQVKVDPKKLNDFVQETMPDHRGRRSPGKEVQPLNEDRIEVAAASSQNWDGICLFVPGPETPVNNEL
jgi:hypothetical protein